MPRQRVCNITVEERCECEGPLVLQGGDLKAAPPRDEEGALLWPNKIRGDSQRIPMKQPEKSCAPRTRSSKPQGGR